MWSFGFDTYLVLTIVLLLCTTASSTPTKPWPSLVGEGVPFRNKDSPLDHQRIHAFLQVEEENTLTHTSSHGEEDRSMPSVPSSKKQPNTQATEDPTNADEDEVRGKYDDTLDGLLGDNALHKHIRSSKNIDTAPSQNPTKTTESGIEDNKNTDIDSQKYYCHHVNSCGVRTLRGPSSVDSTQDGVTCACKGVAENGHVGMCFHGKCYNRQSGQKRRDDTDLDARGLCEYSASDIAPTSLCDLKEQEKRDPNTYYFSDNGLSAHLEKQK